MNNSIFTINAATAVVRVFIICKTDAVEEHDSKPSDYIYSNIFGAMIRSADQIRNTCLLVSAKRM